MGYIKHNTIVVTSWQDEHIIKSREKAVEIFNKHFENDIHDKGEKLISQVVNGLVNGYCSFFIAPDGSKEGWDTSDNGDRAREEFIDWLNNDEDNYCDYVEIVFGGDDGYEKILRSKRSDLAKEKTEI